MDKSALQAMYLIYKKSEKNVAFRCKLGDKDGFFYPGKCLILADRVYTQPKEVGVYIYEDFAWRIEAEKVFFTFKESA